MTLVLPKVSRRSRFLFEFDARACLSAPDQVLDAVTGHVATFSRASTKTALDANGAVRIVPYGLPAFQWSLDPVSGLMTPGVLLEDTRTNLLLRSQEFDNATWNRTNVTVTANAVTAPDGSLTADKVAATATAVTVMNQPGIVATATAHTYSLYVKQGSGATAAASFALYNGTTSATVAGGSLNYATGVFTVTTGTGTVTALVNGWYRLTLTATAGITIGNSLLAYVCFLGGAATAGDYAYVWGGQCEAGAFASSYIPTTTVAVTRSADALSFAFNGLPRALTVYAKFANGGRSTNDAGAAGIVDVGGNGVTPRFLLYHYNAGWYADHSAVYSVCNVPLASGDTVECRGVLNANGTAVSGVSVNGAVETTNATSYALTLEAAWNSANLYVNRYDSGSIGYAAFQSIRIAAGSLTMAQMRAA